MQNLNWRILSSNLQDDGVRLSLSTTSASLSENALQTANLKSKGLLSREPVLM